MTTIKDVAKLAGVSVATVSRVVNNVPRVSPKTKEAVLKVMQELNYTANANARALVTQKNMTIGVVIPDLTDPFFALLAHGVEQIAREQNMQLLLSTCLLTPESEHQAINLLIERQCDVMIVHSTKLKDDELIALSKKVPGLVLIGRLIDKISHRCVWLDNAEGGKIAARHLLSLNHKKFAYISSSLKVDDKNLRLQGFKNALSNDSKENDYMIKEGYPDYQGGERAAQDLLATGNDFSALFVYNDAMAIGAISALEDNGFHVPMDISVIGFDDVLLSSYSRPKLTTLNYPIEEMAMNATKIALSLKTNSDTLIFDEPNRYIPRLVKRESTTLCTK